MPVQQRLESCGPAALLDAELLAWCLGATDPSALRRAQAALQGSGGLTGLLRTPAAELVPRLGLTRAAARRLAAWQELERRSTSNSLEGAPLLGSSAAVTAFLRHRLAGQRREVFSVLYLNSRHRLIGTEDLFLGSVDRAHVHPRVVLQQALARNAAALILAHNHPSGSAEPSRADIELTARLAALLAEVDVRLLDHLVVSPARQVSLADRGLLRSC